MSAPRIINADFKRRLPVSGFFETKSLSGLETFRITNTDDTGPGFLIERIGADRRVDVIGVGPLPPWTGVPPGTPPSWPPAVP